MVDEEEMGIGKKVGVISSGLSWAGNEVPCSYMG